MKINKSALENGKILVIGNYEFLKGIDGQYMIINYKLKIRLQFSSYRMARHTLGQLLNG